MPGAVIVEMAYSYFGSQCFFCWLSVDCLIGANGWNRGRWERLGL